MQVDTQHNINKPKKENKGSLLGTTEMPVTRWRTSASSREKKHTINAKFKKKKTCNINLINSNVRFHTSYSNSTK